MRKKFKLAPYDTLWYSHTFGGSPPLPIIELEPTDTHPVPYNLEEEVPTTFVEELEVVANTVELQESLGAHIEVSSGDENKIQELLRTALEKKQTQPLKQQPVALAAASFLREYGASLALDVAATRAAITNKLMEIANCGNAKLELKALELLGKHSDIGLFTDRSEITINHKSPESLEEAIKERVKRILNANVIDVTPTVKNFDDVFGVAE